MTLIRGGIIKMRRKMHLKRLVFFKRVTECDNLQSVIKYFVKSKKSKQNWTRPGNFDIYFCVSFHHYFQNLDFGR